MNHAKTSFSAEIFAGAIISVVQHLAPLRYVALQAWAYVGAAMCMALLGSLFVPLASFHLPRAAYGPLAYWVFISSMAGYSILTGATQVFFSLASDSKKH
jgi:type IV secretory pathway TraG/TraD family ATPase VirD4